NLFFLQIRAACFFYCFVIYLLRTSIAFPQNIYPNPPHKESWSQCSHLFTCSDLLFTVSESNCVCVCGCVCVCVCVCVGLCVMEVVRLCCVSLCTLVCVCSPGCVIVCVGLRDFVCVFAHECVAASECALVCVCLFY